MRPAVTGPLFREDRCPHSIFSTPSSNGSAHAAPSFAATQRSRRAADAGGRSALPRGIVDPAADGAVAGHRSLERRRNGRHRRLGHVLDARRVARRPFHRIVQDRAAEVTVKFAVADSETVTARTEAQTLDLALVYEDELVAKFAREPLFRQRLYLICPEPFRDKAASVSLSQLANLPLILPSQPNVTRSVLDRTFSAANIVPNVAAEADVLFEYDVHRPHRRRSCDHSEGRSDGHRRRRHPRPFLIEPPLDLTASIISSSDFSLISAGEAVRNVLAQFVNQHLRIAKPPGIEWIGGEPAISAADTRV
jgi:hypothetical protein